MEYIHKSVVNITKKRIKMLQTVYRFQSSHPTSGTKQEKATTTGETSYAGIYTIPLENAVELQPGTTFSVVVQTDTNAVECELEMSIENGG